MSIKSDKQSHPIIR